MDIDPGIVFVIFYTVVFLTGTISIVVSMILDRDNNYSRKPIVKQPKKSSRRYTMVYGDDEDAGVIIYEE